MVSDFTKKSAKVTIVGVILFAFFLISIRPCFATTLGSYRWRNDNGSEAAATFSAAENAPLTSLYRNTPTRLRMSAGNDGTQSELLRKAATSLVSGESDYDLNTGVIDTIHGYAYFGTSTVPAKIVKVSLGTGDAAPVRIGALTLATGENNLDGAVIDPVNGYAYFVTDTSPSIIVKVALGNGDALPTRIGAVTTTGADSANAAAIDTVNGYAYFGSFNWPAKVVKIALGVGINPPTLVGSLTLDGSHGEADLTSAVLDTANGYGYFGTYGDPGIVIKVALGVANALPTRVGAVTLNSGEGYLTTAVIDPGNGYAYFETGTSDPSTVVKIALGVGTNPPTRVGAVTFNSGENNGVSGSSGIDLANGFAYFGTFNDPSKVVKVDLGVGTNPPTRVGAVALNSGENSIRSGMIDPANGYAYFFTGTNPAVVVKVSIAPKAQFRLEYGTKTTTCAAIGSWTQVPVVATTEAWQMIDSANLIDGQATTDNVGIANINTSFQPGQAKDTGSQTSQISLGESQFTELEYSVEATNNAPIGTNYCFRLTNAGTVTPFSVTNYPEVTITSTHTLTYNHGANGTISGSTPQTVDYGGSGTQVTAVPNTGYHFTSWSDGVLTAARTDTNVTGNITVTANFAINTYTLTYNHDANGTVTGTTPQTINYGSDGSAVTAVPNNGYRFVNWSDLSTNNPRTDTNVTADLTVTANFAAAGHSPSWYPAPVPTPPAIAINIPTSGSNHKADDVISIDWSSANGAFIKYKVYYSADSGATYSAIGETPTTSLSWIVPDFGTTQGKIKVEGYDSTGTLLASSTSDGNFTVIGEAMPEAPENPATPSITPPAVDSTVTGTYSSSEAKENNPDFNTDMNIPVATTETACISGSLIKGSLPAVYYCGADGKRYVFVNDKAYFSWYPDFSTVITLSDADLANIPLGGNITYRPGTRLVKIQSDPKVYAVARGGILRWVSTEAIAAHLYGANWAKMVDDIPDSFFVNYTIGVSITEQ
jgi:Divergent InlB B-repeat domain